MTTIHREDKLTTLISSTRHNPLDYVRAAYTWGEGDLKDSAGPREWQKDILNDIGSHLQNPETRR